MAGIWADFPSGSKGIYGEDPDKMLDGPWASVSNGAQLVDDPDPAVGSAGTVLRLNTDGDAVRLVCGAGTPTVGIGVRMWLSSIPAEAVGGGRPIFAKWKTVDNVTIAYAYIDDIGRVAFVNGSGVSTVPLFTADVPSVTANAWWHIESKLTGGAALDAVIEIRVNGITVINETGFTTSAVNTGQATVEAQANGTNNPPTMYVKDFVCWDGTGAQVNNFQGSVTVFYQPVETDVSLGGWAVSYGADASDLLDQVWPSNTLTATGRLDIAGGTISINGVYYAPTAGSVDAGTPAGTSANPWRVAQGADLAGDLDNLFKAINGSGTPGVTYSTALTANSVAEAFYRDETKVHIRSIDKVSTNYQCLEAMTTTSWASGRLDVLVPDDTAYISADSTPPAPASLTIQDLPPDITSIKFIVPIVRAAKVDGGDGNLQVSLTPDAVNYAVGPDTPITTAFTYWGNPAAPFVSHLNPATSAAWTPADFAAGIDIRIDRTL